MTKKFFTNVSPKAVRGIRRAYSGTGADVSVLFDPASGDATVVVSNLDDPGRARQTDDGHAKRTKQHAAA